MWYFKQNQIQIYPIYWMCVCAILSIEVFLWRTCQRWIKSHLCCRGKGKAEIFVCKSNLEPPWKDRGRSLVKQDEKEEKQEQDPAPAKIQFWTSSKRQQEEEGWRRISVWKSNSDAASGAASGDEKVRNGQLHICTISENPPTLVFPFLILQLLHKVKKGQGTFTQYQKTLQPWSWS